MIKDVYLFTNGELLVFDDAGQQVQTLQGIVTDKLKKEIAEGFGDGTRITLARWKKGFFELTREEFANVLFVNNSLVLTFFSDKEKNSDGR